MLHNVVQTLNSIILISKFAQFCILYFQTLFLPKDGILFILQTLSQKIQKISKKILILMFVRSRSDMTSFFFGFQFAQEHIVNLSQNIYNSDFINCVLRFVHAPLMITDGRTISCEYVCSILCFTFSINHKYRSVQLLNRVLARRLAQEIVKLIPFLKLCFVREISCVYGKFSCICEACDETQITII